MIFTIKIGNQVREKPVNYGCFKVKITPSIREDTVFVPFHWGGDQSANRLTNAALDPTSKMPEFKVCATRISAAPELESE